MHLTSEALREVKADVENSNTIMVGDFNTPFSTMNRTFRQKIKKET